MLKVLPEDYSEDLRTILAKERTLLSHQGVQLTKIGLSMGVFASALAIVKFFTEDAAIEFAIAAGLMGISLLVGVRAYVRYRAFALDLEKVQEVEEKMARAHRKKILTEHADGARD